MLTLLKNNKFTVLKEEQTSSHHWKQWQHFESSLKVLKPITLKMNQNEIYVDNAAITEAEYRNNKKRSFFKDLIALVHKCKPLWDRECTDKYMKERLWQKTANLLGIDVECCMQKWKGLREKYIRQKRKYLETGEKWEYLDDLSFLDNVINYRKRILQIPENYNNDSQYEQFSNSDCDVSDKNLELYAESVAGSRIKTEEQQSSCSTESINNRDADSTLEENRTPEMSYTRKRAASPAVFVEHYTKKRKNEQHTRTPEEIFGEFVAASLANKSESGRNDAMIQIMTVLAKTN